MRKSLTRFIINSVKSDPKFEERLASVFSLGQAGEDALDSLTAGVPVSIKTINPRGAVEANLNKNEKCIKILGAKLSDDRTNIRITYIEGCTKYFESQEKADAARSRYDGGYTHDDNGKLTITRTFEYEGACSVSVSDAEEYGWFQIIRQ